MNTANHPQVRGRHVSCLAAILSWPMSSLSLVHAQAPDQYLENGKAALAAFHEACTADDAETWGISLCGPVVLIDVRSRFAVANTQDPDGVFQSDGAFFVGQAPDELGGANTSVLWGGMIWATARFPVPGDQYSAVELLAHESFHRIQSDVGITASDPVVGHLGEREGRIWLRLELRAFAAALAAGTRDDAMRSFKDAALFRMSRYRKYPDARQREAQLEMAEGLAAYTGARLAQTAATDGVDRVVQLVQRYDSRDSYARSFAYATGPAIGMLLDRLGRDGWRSRVVKGGELTEEMIAAAGPGTLAVAPYAVTAREDEYGGAAVRADEAEREHDRLELFADYRARLVDGPVLVLRQEGLGRSFNPNTLMPFSDHGTIYPTGSFSAAWGSLEVEEGGALVAPDFTTLRVPAPKAGGEGIVVGSGWTLKLAVGWRVVVRPDGNAELRNNNQRRSSGM